jgi:hypothetical protein
MRATSGVTLKKMFLTALVVCALALFFGFLAVDKYFYSTRPHERDPDLGRTYPEKIKGFSGVADVYLTRTEKRMYDYSGCILGSAGVLFTAAAVLNQRWKVVHNLTLRGWELPK